MSTLHDELAARAHAIAASTPAAPQSAPDVIRTVKRKARAKFATGAGMALAVVLVAAAGTLFALDRDPAPPVAPFSPSPSATPSATPSASPTPEVTVDADGRALPGFVTVAEDLPDALPLPAGLLGSTEPGWVLGLYRPEVGHGSYSDDPTLINPAQYQVIYIASPDGTRYQVLELPPNPRIVLAEWDAGSSTALVGVCDTKDDTYCGSYQLGRLDLTTGTIDSSAYKDVSPASLISTYPGGAALWSTLPDALVLTEGAETTQFDGHWELWDSMPDDGMSPSGNLVIVNSFDYDTQETTWAIVDLEEHTLTPMAMPTGHGGCWADGWNGPETLVMDCFDSDGVPPTYWALDVRTGAIEETDEYPAPMSQLGANDASVFPDYFVGDGEWVGSFAHDDQDRSQDYEPEFGIARDGDYLKVPVPYPGRGDTPTLFALAKEGPLVYLEGSFTSADVASLVALSVYDVEDDTVTLLFPYPPGGPTIETDNEAFGGSRALESWAVAR